MSDTEGAAKTVYDRFAMYGFSLEYPSTWNLELQPKSAAEAGDVAFKTLGIRVFLTWGSLDKARQRYGSLDKQVEDSLTRMRKSGDVRRFEIVEQKEMTLNGHRAIYSSTRASLGVGLLAMKTSHREVCTLHLHCEPSKKYLVLYASGVGQGSLEQFSETFSHMSASLKCHSRESVAI